MGCSRANREKYENRDVMTDLGHAELFWEFVPATLNTHGRLAVSDFWSYKAYIAVEYQLYDHNTAIMYRGPDAHVYTYTPLKFEEMKLICYFLDVMSVA